MTLHLDRRMMLRALGLQLALPLVSTVLPDTARANGSGGGRSRFIGVFFPNGAHMPQGQDGNWNFSDALQPLAQAGFQPNTMVVRGLFNGFDGVDPHWQNCAGFLSCRRIVLGDAAVARAGKTVDQLVADQHPAPLRSLEVGAPYYHVHPLDDHPGYSNDYLNRIAWQTDDRFRAPTADPRQMFERLFATNDAGAERVRYLHSKKQSVLDYLHKDADRLARRLPATYRPVLSDYMDSVREVESQLGTIDGGCAAPGPAPTTDFRDPQRNYVARYHLMNQMVATAMQCGLVNAATFMYGPSSSDLTAVEVLGNGAGHHSVAHNRGEAPLITRLRGMVRLHTGLLAHLLGQLRDRGLLDSTLVLYGSDMSDGDLHTTTNIPTLLCGAGSDLRFGQDVGSASQPRPLANLHVEILQLLGLTSVTSFGAGQAASTSAGIAIRV
jgi:hypothetical protein